MRQNTASLTMAEELRFLCDEMLAGLGRWLRIAGYDTAIAAYGCRDRDLVEQAHAEQRILLTRDRRLVEIRWANDRTIVLNGNSIDACARELGLRLALDWTLDPLSRCTLCNMLLDLADHRLRKSLPPRIRDTGSPVHVALAVATCTGKAATSAASAGGWRALPTKRTMAMQIEIRCTTAGRGSNMMISRIDRRGFILAWLPLLTASNAGAMARGGDVLVVDDFSRDDLISRLGTPWRGFSDQVMGGASPRKRSRLPRSMAAVL